MEKYILQGKFCQAYYVLYITDVFPFFDRLESYQVWTTAQAEDIKYRGYIEVK